MTRQEGVRLAIIAIAALSFAAWTLVWARCPLPARARAILPGLWALHVLAFTLVAQLHLASPADLNLWSSALRVHGLVSSIVLARDYLIAEPDCA
jgi:hypothetical protein